MNVPKLPMDNLYKFLAMTGLVMFVLSWLVPLHAIFDIQKQIARVDGQRVRWDQKVIDWNHRASIVGRSEPKQRLSHNEYYRATQHELLAKGQALLDQFAGLQGKDATIRNLLEDLAHWESAFAWGSVLGSVVMTTGFCLWYLKTQRYQDIILKRQAERLVDPASGDSGTARDV